VIVWDAGTYDNHSRDRDGRELTVDEAISRGHVSVVLHGKKLRGGYSLTRMRRGGRPAWLLVKKADEFAGGDPVKTSPESVRSGKTVDQLGTGQSQGHAERAPGRVPTPAGPVRRVRQVRYLAATAGMPHQNNRNSTTDLIPTLTP